MHHSSQPDPETAAPVGIALCGVRAGDGMYSVLGHDVSALTGRPDTGELAENRKCRRCMRKAEGRTA